MRNKRDVCLNVARTVLKWLQPGAKVLDFGAGPCDKTAVLALLGFECTSYDDLQDDWHQIGGNRDKILSFAEQVGIRYEVAVEGNLPFESNEFDMVMLHDVLEHLHDSPRDLLNDLMACVKPGGYLFVTVPNAVNLRKRLAVLRGKTNLAPFATYYWYPGAWRGHIREYVKDDLVQFADFLGLETVELRSCHHMLSRLPTYARPVFVAVTAIAQGWRDSWLLVARKGLGWQPKKTLPRDEINRILDQSTSYQY